MSGTLEYRATDKRPLSTEERTLVEWLIAHGTAIASSYSSQVPRATVVSRCTCGCPTIDLAVNGKQAFGPSEIIADAEGTSPEGVAVGVILHCRAGQLSELEVYPIEKTQGPFSLPGPSTLIPLTDSPESE